MIQTLSFDTPIGPISIDGDNDAIHSIRLLTTSANSPVDYTLLVECKSQLQAFFAGKLTQFSLPIRPHGTDFQVRIWQLLQDIPFGQTISYLELALRAGNRNLTRAVGAANAQNPIPILIPCHRVIGSNGSLTGFAGGLAAKQWLLEHERRQSASQLYIDFR